MRNRKLPRHGQHSALTRRIRKLRRRRPNNSHHARRVNNAPLCLPVPPQRAHGVLAAVPHALDVDPHREVPDGVGRLLGVAVLGVHDARVVEHDVDAAPRVQVVDGGLDVGFLGDVGGLGLEAAGALGDDFVYPGERLF